MSYSRKPSRPEVASWIISSSPSTSHDSFFPDGPAKSDSLGRIVTSAHTQRIKNLIDGTKGTVVFGGDADVARKYIAPTLVKDVSGDDSLMSECVVRLGRLESVFSFIGSRCC